MKQIRIFDTTLRDGEQASGFHMFGDEKIAIARQLATLGVDIIEAGFAASSVGDAESIARIAREVGGNGGPTICSLSRAVKGDIAAAAKAIAPAAKGRIHTFIATSDNHISGKFRKDRDWVFEQAVNAIRYAREFTDDVEFSCEDFGRSDISYTTAVVKEAIRAGASTINLPDTVGYLMPHECYELFSQVISSVRKDGLDAIFSVHNHNDLGLATATTLAAVMAGARQIEVTVNGIGERAGNTSLEEMVAIITERSPGGVYCSVNTKEIGPTSRLVSAITGVYPQPNKAIVGKNAFAHEAGIHQDGMIKDASTYEIMNPDAYGVKSVLTFGARSGSHALRGKYAALGIEVSDENFASCAQRFFAIADEQKEIDDADVVRSVHGDGIDAVYALEQFHPVINGGFGAYVCMHANGSNTTAYSAGNGQIDALVQGIRSVIGREYHIVDFLVRSQGSGSKAEGRSQVVMSDGRYEVVGRSQSSDVVTSAAEAFVDGCNRLEYIRLHRMDE